MSVHRVLTWLCERLAPRRPLIRTIRPRMMAAQPLPPLPSKNDVTGDFPVVVVVDSGIASNIPGLESWVVGRDAHVAPQYSNTGARGRPG